jgi:hypothetical protein
MVGLYQVRRRLWLVLEEGEEEKEEEEEEEGHGEEEEEGQGDNVSEKVEIRLSQRNWSSSSRIRVEGSSS